MAKELTQNSKTFYMKNYTENASQILRDAVATFLAREAGPQSLITVTRARCSSGLDHATVYLSVLPREKEAAALSFANRTVEDLKKYLREHTKLPRNPYIDFVIDKAEDLPTAEQAGI